MSRRQLSDRQAFVIAALRQDQAAYPALLDPLWRIAYLKAYRILQDGNLGENVAQDCCLKLFVRLRTLGLYKLALGRTIER